MRAFLASFAAEINTFSPVPTGRGAFESSVLTRNASITGEGMGGAALREYRVLAEADGYEIVESLSAYAHPAGRILRSVYEEYRDQIVRDLGQAGEIDLILLLLHGAMAADGYDDCEGDILTRARAAAPTAVIGAVLDPHCHLSRAMVEAADILVSMKEYPHTDLAAASRDLYRLCQNAKRAPQAFAAALVDTRMIGLYPTEHEPMRGIVDRLTQLEADGHVLSASIAHGFPWGDVADVGTRVLVYARDASTANETATDIAAALYRARDALRPDYPDLSTSLDRADTLEGCVVLGDHGDNPGGGAPGDATFALRALLDRGMRDAVLGPLFDPVVASLCCEVGAGARLALRVGGKSGPASGDPVDIVAEVRAIAPAHVQTAFGEPEPMGPSAALHVAGIDIVVTSQRSQAYGRDLFESLGVRLRGRRLVIVKSSHHYKHDFSEIADHIWSMASPGALDLNFAAQPYTKRDRRYFPREADPWALHGAPQPQIFNKGKR